LTLLDGWQEGHPACKKTEWWGAEILLLAVTVKQSFKIPEYSANL